MYPRSCRASVRAFLPLFILALFVILLGGCGDAPAGADVRQLLGSEWQGRDYAIQTIEVTSTQQPDKSYLVRFKGSARLTAPRYQQVENGFADPADGGFDAGAFQRDMERLMDAFTWQERREFSLQVDGVWRMASQTAVFTRSAESGATAPFEGQAVAVRDGEALKWQQVQVSGPDFQGVPERTLTGFDSQTGAARIIKASPQHQEQLARVTKAAEELRGSMSARRDAVLAEREALRKQARELLTGSTYLLGEYVGFQGGPFIAAFTVGDDDSVSAVIEHPENPEYKGRIEGRLVPAVDMKDGLPLSLVIKGMDIDSNRNPTPFSLDQRDFVAAVEEGVIKGRNPSGWSDGFTLTPPQADAKDPRQARDERIAAFRDRVLMASRSGRAYRGVVTVDGGEPLEWILMMEGEEGAMASGAHIFWSEDQTLVRTCSVQVVPELYLAGETPITLRAEDSSETTRGAQDFFRVARQKIDLAVDDEDNLVIRHRKFAGTLKPIPMAEVRRTVTALNEAAAALLSRFEAGDRWLATLSRQGEASQSAVIEVISSAPVAGGASLTLRASPGNGVARRNPGIVRELSGKVLTSRFLSQGLPLQLKAEGNVVPANSNPIYGSLTMEVAFASDGDGFKGSWNGYSVTLTPLGPQ